MPNLLSVSGVFRSRQAVSLKSRVPTGKQNQSIALQFFVGALGIAPAPHFALHQLEKGCILKFLLLEKKAGDEI